MIYVNYSSIKLEEEKRKLCEVKKKERERGNIKLMANLCSRQNDNYENSVATVKNIYSIINEAVTKNKAGRNKESNFIFYV